jgi:predicted HicB family RNase H-like nuclease
MRNHKFQSRFNFFLEKDDHEALARLARQAGLDLAQYVRMILRKELYRQAKKQSAS